MPYGMKFAKEGKDLAQRQAGIESYDSSHDIVQAALSKDPSHINVINPLQQATAYNITLNSGTDIQYREETLFQVEHNMPFAPDFICYFYCYDSPTPDEIGSYRLDYYRVGFGGEYIQAYTDDKYFKIVHSVRLSGAPPGTTYPTTIAINGASQRKYRVKYIILQRPTLGFLDYAAY